MEQRAREESLQAKSILLIFYCVCKLCSSTDICVSESERYESARTRERSENGQKHTDTVCVCVLREVRQRSIAHRTLKPFPKPIPLHQHSNVTLNLVSLTAAEDTLY